MHHFHCMHCLCCTFCDVEHSVHTSVRPRSRIPPLLLYLRYFHVSPLCARVQGQAMLYAVKIVKTPEPNLWFVMYINTIDLTWLLKLDDDTITCRRYIVKRGCPNRRLTWVDAWKLAALINSGCACHQLALLHFNKFSITLFPVLYDELEGRCEICVDEVTVLQVLDQVLRVALKYRQQIHQALNSQSLSDGGKDGKAIVPLTFFISFLTGHRVDQHWLFQQCYYLRPHWECKSLSQLQENQFSSSSGWQTTQWQLETSGKALQDLSIEHNFSCFV